MDTNTLNNLAFKYNCDKTDHNYMAYYSKHLPQSPKRILEVGCEMGESLRIWRELWPQAEIHTIDLFENPLFESDRRIASEGFITHKGDQFYRKTYNSLDGKFDLIIEDGSHRADHQIFTFYMLYEKFLASEGLYVAEDLHCCQEEFFRGQIGSFEDTLLASIERKGSWFYAQYGQLIHSVDVYDRKIAFIKKRIV